MKEEINKYPHLEAGAKSCILAARKQYNAEIIMMVDGFQTDEEALCLRDMLWYARDNGVKVNVIPMDLKKENNEED